MVSKDERACPLGLRLLSLDYGNGTTHAPPLRSREKLPPDVSLEGRLVGREPLPHLPLLVCGGAQQVGSARWLMVSGCGGGGVVVVM